MRRVLEGDLAGTDDETEPIDEADGKSEPIEEIKGKVSTLYPNYNPRQQEAILELGARIFADKEVVQRLFEGAEFSTDEQRIIDERAFAFMKEYSSNDNAKIVEIKVLAYDVPI